MNRAQLFGPVDTIADCESREAAEAVVRLCEADPIPACYWIWCELAYPPGGFSVDYIAISAELAELRRNDCWPA